MKINIQETKLIITGQKIDQGEKFKYLEIRNGKLEK